jgi:hypothetical protein
MQLLSAEESQLAVVPVSEKSRERESYSKAVEKNLRRVSECR